jgi:hypothetical protein
VVKGLVLCLESYCLFEERRNEGSSFAYIENLKIKEIGYNVGLGV